VLRRLRRGDLPLNPRKQLFGFREGQSQIGDIAEVIRLADCHDVHAGTLARCRNTASPHWRRWLAPENRCVVPFTSFAENETLPDGRKPPIWFALDAARSLACFADIWTNWTSVRKVREGETNNDLFAFLTTEPNRLIGTYHPKAMPVILRTPDEIDTWMEVPVALQLQRPLPDNALMITVMPRATGTRIRKSS